MLLFKVQSPQEINVVKELLLEYFDYLKDKVEPQDFAGEIKNLVSTYLQPENSIIFAHDNDKAIGCVGIKKICDKKCELKRLYVKEEHRNQGIGKILLLKIIEDAKAKNYQKILLATPPNFDVAIGIYKKLGFKDITAFRKAYHHSPKFMKLEL